MKEKDKRTILLKDLAPLVTGIAKMFGKNCEVILHDTSDLQNSVIAIENSHITGRQVGGPMSTGGLYFLKSDLFRDVDYVANYRTETNDKKTIKSTTMFIRDQNRKIAGFLCINFAIDDFIDAKEKIEEFCLLRDESDIVSKEAEEEDFVGNPEELFSQIFQKAINNVNKKIDEMDKEDKKKVVKYLYDRGAFLVKGTIEKAAKRMNVSKYTIYNYLAEVKSQTGEKPLV
ncbi:YheO-like domain-containing protein [uncultured Spirochaetota bacterium]|jgi:predicted transcriptional regulator YheO|uniref:YheO-like domain-containing protein n=1 Tax=uncultured Spirochaetota bacterium TaxID=460511 RepID=A0A652ZS49_9SPIR|nr:YheO-like domain-containing protein [uncultured Spirochaetota bacterium]